MSSLYDSLPIPHPERDKFYKVHRIPKRSGGVRIVEAPDDTLKALQKKVYDKIRKRVRVSKHAYGCLPKRNTVQASSVHLGADAILKIDLKDCFHSITEESVKSEMLFAGFSERDACMIAALCTNSRSVLPQGAPTSPLLANVVMRRMYAALHKVASAAGCVFSGYLDDLVFSGDGKTLRRLFGTIRRVITDYGLVINNKKISFMRTKKEVLGVCVADGKDHTRLPKKRRNHVRGKLHLLKTLVEAGDRSAKTISLFHNVSGHISYALMVGDQKAKHFEGVIKNLRERLFSV